MGRGLSLFCCCPCLPRKQRDNLSSRSLYPDQDSSGQDEYCTDEDEADNNDYAHFHHNDGHRNHQHRKNSTNTYENPWPSDFFNGRFSRQANRNRSIDGAGPGYGHRPGGRSRSRKSNPFRTPRHDDDDEEDIVSSRHRQEPVAETGATGFEPYHDDDSDGDNSTGQVIQEPGHEGRNALNTPSAVHPKTAYTPYRVQTGFPTTNPSRKMVRAPRNPQGKMAWMDDEDDEDADELIDVDALIAEQERITRELAAQEEALQKEEEAAIIVKRLAAIRAAEKRGLLRFEGDQLVIPGNNSSNNSHDGPSVQDENEWDYSRRGENQPHHHYMERTPSMASSFVGGVDAFNQELKMMNLEISRQERSKQKQPPRYYSEEESKNVQQWLATTTDASAASLPASPTVISRAGSTTSGSITRPATRARAASIGVSTSTSTSTSGPSVAINPRGVFNNIASFLKKVDGVIAGDGGDSSDEADKEQDDSLQQQQGVAANNMSGPQAPAKMSGEQRDEEETSTVIGGYSTRAVKSQDKSAVVAISLDSEELEQTYPEDPFNSLTNSQMPSDAQDEDEDPSSSPTYSADPFNSSSRKDTHSSSSKSSVSGRREVKTVPVAAPVVPERMMSTFSSIFNTGSSLMGSLFGGGGVGIGGIGFGGDSSREDDDYYGRNRGDMDDGKRMSSLKYGDPMTHQFNYREYHREDDDSGAATSARETMTAGDEGEDSDSIDDYDF